MVISRWDVKPCTLTHSLDDCVLFIVIACSVHSQQKHQIASRLVRGALNVAYRQSDVSFQGPWPTGYMISAQSSTLSLSFDASDLYVHKQHEYVGFEVGL